MTTKVKGLSAMPARLGWATLAVVLLGTISGCGTKASSNSVKVLGIVTLDGSRLGGAKVTYYPSSGENPPFGVTDSEGRFELTTFDLKTLKTTDGALPGEYKVTVEIRSPSGRDPGAPEDKEAAHMRRPKAATQSAPAAKLLHANYTDVAKTPLKQVVPSQGPVELKLTKSGT